MAVYSMESSYDSCYPGTSVLVNKLGIKDQEMLSFAEQRIVTALYAKAEAEMELNEPVFDSYKKLHKYLFYDIYDWAGSIRTINISKKGTIFCDEKDIENIGNSKFIW